MSFTQVKQRKTKKSRKRNKHLTRMRLVTPKRKNHLILEFIKVLLVVFTFAITTLSSYIVYWKDVYNTLHITSCCSSTLSWCNASWLWLCRTQAATSNTFGYEKNNLLEARLCIDRRDGENIQRAEAVSRFRSSMFCRNIQEGFSTRDGPSEPSPTAVTEQTGEQRSRLMKSAMKRSAEPNRKTTETVGLKHFQQHSLGFTVTQVYLVSEFCFKWKK